MIRDVNRQVTIAKKIHLRDGNDDNQNGFGTAFEGAECLVLVKSEYSLSLVNFEINTTI